MGLSGSLSFMVLKTHSYFPADSYPLFPIRLTKDAAALSN